jgi:hypothetical protein
VAYAQTLLENLLLVLARDGSGRLHAVLIDIDYAFGI